MPAKLPFDLDPLFPGLVLPKPKNSVADETILDLENRDRLLITRKRDGHCVTAVITDKPRIYTRGKVADISDNFPFIINDLKRAKVPKNTLFACELVAEKDDSDWREFVSTLAADQDPARAIKAQEQKGWARLAVFNIFVLEGALVASQTNMWRYNTLRGLLDFKDLKCVSSVQILNDSFADAQERVLKNHWEGLVLYDKSAVSQIRLDGRSDNPPRPTGCWKRKPSYEDDFIATGYVKGTAGKRHEHRMGKLLLYQVDPTTGDLVSCGEVGTGFSDDERSNFAHSYLYPFVVQVEYERRFPMKKLSRGRVQFALCNPRFIRSRVDKTLGACLLPEELLTSAGSHEEE